METFWQDVRYGVRMLARQPGFTLVAVVTLALGIGANTAIFSVVNGVLLRTLPYEEPQRLVLVWETHEKRGTRTNSVSYPNFHDWHDQNSVFEDLASFRAAGLTLTGLGTPERIVTGVVASGFFPTLRVEPLIGRTFRPEDDKVGAEPVVVLSHAFWQQQLGTDPQVLGRRLTLDGKSFIVIGVLPAGFQFPIQVGGAQLWISAVRDADAYSERGAHFLRVLARLKAGVTLEQAQAEMDAIARRLEKQYPEENTARGVNLVPLHEQLVGNIRPALLVLLAAVGFVLLIACVNVANLLLARSSGRSREFAIRTALGASKGRLIRQVLTEGATLALAGGAGGVLLGVWCFEGLLGWLPPEFPLADRVRLDGSVLSFTLGVSLFTGLLVGMMPALNASPGQPSDELKEGGRVHGSLGRQRVRTLLVISEVALTLVLLVGAGLLTHSFWRVVNLDPGFRSEGGLTFNLSLPWDKYETAEKRAAFYGEVAERLATLPGVEAVGATTTLPLGDNFLVTGYTVAGEPEPPAAEQPSIVFHSVTPGYFRALGIPLKRGRLFTPQDTRRSGGVILLSESLVRRYFPDRDPLGRKLTLGMNVEDSDPREYEVVGIVGDVRQRTVEAEVPPSFYIPYTQQAWGWMTFAVRTDQEPSRLAAAIREQVQAIALDQPVYGVRTMEERLGAAMAQRRFTMLLVGVFAVLAMALAAVGVYGLMAYSVAQRTHELGIRMALGAQPRDILRLVIRQGLTLLGVGIGVGVAGAFALTRFLRTLLFGVTPTDPVTFVAVAGLLTAVGLLACWLPARRATRVEPLVALRYE